MKLKVTLALVLGFVMSLAAWSQNEQDFASHFMAQHAAHTTLQCTTVSPLMLEKVMQLPNVENDSETQRMLSQLKSIRLVRNARTSETQHLQSEALSMMKRNSARYKLYGEQQGRWLYVRYRNNLIVEMVLVMQREHLLHIINLTGNMTKSFLNHLITSH